MRESVGLFRRLVQADPIPQTNLAVSLSYLSVSGGSTPLPTVEPDR